MKLITLATVVLALVLLSASCASPAAAISWIEVDTAGGPAFENGWRNYAPTPQGLAFGTSEDGFLHVIGTIEDATPTTFVQNVFTIPTGYRPGTPQYFTVDAFASGGGSVLATISVMSDGRFAIGGNPAPSIVYLGHLIVPMH